MPPGSRHAMQWQQAERSGLRLSVRSGACGVACPVGRLCRVIMTIGIETVEAVVPVRGSVSICSAEVICGPIGTVGVAPHDGLVVSNEIEMGVMPSALLISLNHNSSVFDIVILQRVSCGVYTASKDGSSCLGAISIVARSYFTQLSRPGLSVRIGGYYTIHQVTMPACSVMLFVHLLCNSRSPIEGKITIF